tara:strand:+ start:116 stop:334 length:219 start_codon:yes stop_codon:yes gene_type:complete
MKTKDFKIWLLTHPVENTKDVKAMAYKEGFRIIDIKFINTVDKQEIGKVDNTIWENGKPKAKRKPKAAKLED